MIPNLSNVIAQQLRRAAQQAARARAQAKPKPPPAPAPRIDRSRDVSAFEGRVKDFSKLGGVVAARAKTAANVDPKKVDTAYDAATRGGPDTTAAILRKNGLNPDEKDALIKRLATSP